MSVLIPCFNAEMHITHAVNSCLNQDHQNIEVIVVDDGSTDKSLVELRKIKNTKLRVYTQSNRGASAARNHAYQFTCGQYIQHLDADDFLSPDKIKNQVDILTEEGNQLAISLSKTVYFYDGDDPEDGFQQNAWPIVDHDSPLQWLIEMLGPEQGSMVQPGAWLTPRTITDIIGPWNEGIDPSPDVDGEYFARAVLASKKIRRSREGAAFYRKYRMSKSMSSQRSENYLLGGVRSMDLIADLLLSKTQDPRAKKALARRYKEWAFTCYPHAPKVTQACLKKAEELGFGEFRPAFPTKVGRLLCTFLGWKLTKRLNYSYHQMKGRFGRR